MEEKKKVIGKPFQKGNNANPGGRPKLPKELLEMKKLNNEELIKKLNHYIHLSSDELKKKWEDKSLSAIDLIVVSAIIYTIQKGDRSARDFIIERLCGKVPDAPKDVIQQPHDVIMRELEQITKGHFAESLNPELEDQPPLPDNYEKS